MANKQRFGLVNTPDENLINVLKENFKKFCSWAMIGEGINGSGVYISRSELQKMLDDNPDSDGFKICLGLTETPDDLDVKTHRSLEIIITAITFEDDSDENLNHSSDSVYTRFNNSPEPPVMQCPPLQCA